MNVRTSPGEEPGFFYGLKGACHLEFCEIRAKYREECHLECEAYREVIVAINPFSINLLTSALELTLLSLRVGAKYECRIEKCFLTLTRSRYAPHRFAFELTIVSKSDNCYSFLKVLF